MILSRGPAALRQLLDTRLHDLRALEPDRFGAWLQHHLPRWQRDPAFRQRARIRDLRRAHPELLALEQEHRLAEAADRAAPEHAALQAAQRELTGAERAVQGLSHALERAEPADRPRLRAKLQRFRERADRLAAGLRERERASAPRTARDRIAGRLHALREQLGLPREEELLRALQRRRGRSAGRRGEAFEQAARAAVRRELLPELHGGAAGRPLEILDGVRLGAARTEIDQLVVRAPAAPREPVEVLALVEAKRNINDLAHGLRRRLENLGWLGGRRESYDAAQYETGGFPSGHFEGVAIHEQDGRRYRFAPASFARFHDADQAAERVYLATRPGSLWGIDSAGLARLAHRVATDEAWQPDDADYLAGLLSWSQALTHPVEAPDVLRAHAARPAAARRVLLLEP